MSRQDFEQNKACLFFSSGEMTVVLVSEQIEQGQSVCATLDKEVVLMGGRVNCEKDLCMRMGEPDCWKSQESAVARPSLGLGRGEWGRLEEEEEAGHPLGHTALCRAGSLAFFFFLSLLRRVRF